MHEESAVTQTDEPGFEITVYDTAAPPSEEDLDHDTLTEPSPTVPTTASKTGAGGVEGVALGEAFDAALVPDAFVAVTVNV